MSADLTTEAANGDRVTLHHSEFHGIVVRASRQYIDKPNRSEVCAYFGDPQALMDWLFYDLGLTHTPEATE